MNTLGSHPGAILFRLSIMIILIAILIAVFFSYVGDTEKELERSSILQTKKIIDSSLAVVFATYAVRGRLNELNDLDGGNPFEFLREFEIQLPAYRGAIRHDLDDSLEPGWYYLAHRRRVAYKPYYLPENSYYEVVLSYDDVDASGRFDQGVDKFRNLGFGNIR